MLLQGTPVAQIEREMLPERRTIKRWGQWLHDAFLAHSHTLLVHFPQLGKSSSIEIFWFVCLKQMNLARAMFYVHCGKVVVP